MILRADTVLPMAGDAADPATAVAFAGDRIASVGRNGDIAAQPGQPEWDFGDRVLMPGFIDVHAHYEVAARVRYATVDCRAPACKDVEDVLEVLSRGARDTSTGWVVGQGNLFLDQKLADRRMPTREELDEAGDECAIALRAGGHITVLNSRALELAGIDNDYEPPQGSVTGQPIVERDADGRLTGVVKEMDSLLPLPSMGDAALKQALKEGALELFTKHGVTTIGEITETVAGLNMMDELALENDLSIRVAGYLWVPGTMPLERACQSQLSFRAASEHLSIRGIKLFADGGFTAASAAVKRPYAIDPCSHGTLALSQPYLTEVAEMAANAGLQLAVHANGERAQELVCKAVAAAAPRDGFPIAPRIEHAGNFLPDRSLTERWREAGIIPVPQPVFIFTLGEFIPTYVGDYGHHGQFPLRTLIDDGWSLSGSSDVWIGSELRQTNPLFSIWCCVERRGFFGNQIEPEQAISVDEALWMHTMGGAKVIGHEREKGSLESGKLADVIVLAQDPRTVKPSALADIPVDYVFLGGRCVYRRPGAEPYTEVAT
jgi:predicted amidohydrolase YtcJ